MQDTHARYSRRKDGLDTSIAMSYATYLSARINFSYFVLELHHLFSLQKTMPGNYGLMIFRNNNNTIPVQPVLLSWDHTGLGCGLGTGDQYWGKVRSLCY